MRLKGSEKRIVYMKNTGGRLFCEAFFVLCEAAGEPRESDMLAEANRILDEHLLSSPKRRHTRAFGVAVAFFAGAALSALGFLLAFCL